MGWYPAPSKAQVFKWNRVIVAFLPNGSQAASLYKSDCSAAIKIILRRCKNHLTWQSEVCWKYGGFESLKKILKMA